MSTPEKITGNVDAVLMLLRDGIVEKQRQEQKRTDRRKTGIINGPAVTGGGFSVLKFVAAPWGSDVTKVASWHILSPGCPGIKIGGHQPPYISWFTSAV